MRPRWSPLSLCLTFLLVAMAGCVAPEAAPDTSGDPLTPAAPSFSPLPDDGINNQDISPGKEPAILTDRTGAAIWIGDTSGVYRSGDNGTTWTRLDTLDQQISDGYTLAQDDEGRLYAATTNIPYINVHRYDDGETRSWTSLATEAAPIADRPWLAARGDGEVTLIHYDFGRTFSESCARSTDAGTTWLDRDLMHGSPQPGNLVYGEDGGLYFLSGRTLYRSADGTCSATAEQYDLFPDTRLGATMQMKIALEGPHVYAAAPTEDNKDLILSGAKSDLSGTPKQLRLGVPGLGSNTFTTISAHGDEVAVAWYGSDGEGDPSSTGFEGDWHTYVARITGFWNETPEITFYQVSDQVIHRGVICMGGVGCSGGRELLDYFYVDHDIWGTLHIAYGHDDGTRYARITPEL